MAFLEINKIPLGIWKMFAKIIFDVFTLLLRFLSLRWDKKYIPYWQVFLIIISLVDSISSKIVCINKLHYFNERNFVKNLNLTNSI